jgi:ABC-type phosphate transport system ATPase subunit
LGCALAVHLLHQLEGSAGVLVRYMVEYGPTQRLFENPTEEYTKEYVSGQFG